MEVTFKSGGRKIFGMVEFPSSVLPAPAGDHPVLLSPTPAAILCHGWTNSMTTCPLINDTAKLLLSLGFIVCRFDFYGSGKSDGLFRDKVISESIINLEDAISYFSSQDYILPGHIGLWGRSLGATIAAICSTRRGIKTSVLISCILDIKRNFYDYYIRGGKSDYTPVSSKGAAVGIVKGDYELSRNFFEELDDIETRLKTELQKSQSVLIIQGDQDQRAEVDSARNIYNLVHEPRSLYIVKNCNHAYTGHEEEVSGVQGDWYKTNLL